MICLGGHVSAQMFWGISIVGTEIQTLQSRHVTFNDIEDNVQLEVESCNAIDVGLVIDVIDVGVVDIDVIVSVCDVIDNVIVAGFTYEELQDHRRRRCRRILDVDSLRPPPFLPPHPC